MDLRNDLKLLLVEHNLVPAALLRRRQYRELRSWERTRLGHFPHLLKQRIVLECAAAAGTRIFFETGTYYGLMLLACLKQFDLLYSIEGEPHFHRRARKVFGNRPNVRLLLGDSANLLPQVVKTIDSPCLFWLDAHYSGGLTGRAEIETPIRNELDAIFNHPCKHVILIDDADCFDGTHGYPKIEWISDTARAHGYSFSRDRNVVRLQPVG